MTLTLAFNPLDCVSLANLCLLPYINCSHFTYLASTLSTQPHDTTSLTLLLHIYDHSCRPLEPFEFLPFVYPRSHLYPPKISPLSLRDLSVLTKDLSRIMVKVRRSSRKNDNIIVSIDFGSTYSAYVPQLLSKPQSTTLTQTQFRCHLLRQTRTAREAGAYNWVC